MSKNRFKNNLLITTGICLALQGFRGGSDESMFCPRFALFASLDVIADFAVFTMFSVFGLRERVNSATRRI